MKSQGDKEATGRAFVSIGYALLWIAVLLLGISLLVSTIVQYGTRIHFQQNHLVLTNNKSSSNFKRFVSNSNGEDAPEYVAFTFWNLMNFEDVLKGGKPTYKEQGSYYYQAFRNKLNVTFLANDTMARFVPENYFVFSDAQSGELKSTDEVTGFNNAYLNLLATFGTERGMRYAYSSPLIGSWLDGIFSGDYLVDTRMHYSAEFLLSEVYIVIRDFMKAKNMTQEEAEAKVCSIWTNATTSGDIDGVPVNDVLKVSLQSKVKTGMSQFTCSQLLLNVSNEFSFVSSGNYVNSALKQWINADADTKASLEKQFSLSPEQLEALYKWFNSDLFNEWLTKTLNDVIGVKVSSEIPLVQFGQGTVSPSLKELYPDLFTSSFPSPEFYFSGNGTKDNYLSMSSVRSFLYGMNGILKDSQNMNLVYKYISKVQEKDFDVKFLTKTWGITADEAGIIKKSLNSFDTTYNARDVLNLVNSSKSGLFVTKTVDEWLFSNCDDLYMKFFPKSNCLFFVFNATTKLAAFDKYDPSIVFTGNKTIFNLYSFDVLNGRNTTIFNTKLTGSSERQFLPFLRPNTFNYFDLNYQKSIIINATEDLGNTTQFVYADSTWNSNVTGLSSIAAAYNGVPYYIGNPYLNGVEKEYLHKISGVVQPKNNSITKPLFGFFNIDSNTGIPVEANLCSQINLFLSKTDIGMFDVKTFNHELIQTETIWPIFYQREYTEATKAQRQVILEMQAKEASDKTVYTYTGVGTGIVLFVVGLVLFVVGVPRINKKGYVMIN